MLTRTSGGVTTTFLWDGWDCIRESTPTSTTHYLIPEAQLLGFRRDGEHYSVASDALGCVRLVTHSSGDVVFRRDYGAWGETLPGGFDNVPGGMPYGFVGALGVRTDADSGLIYLRQRWYDPTAQRFISRDPIGLEGGANRYRYRENNPMTFVDPSGLVPGAASLAMGLAAQARKASGTRRRWRRCGTIIVEIDVNSLTDYYQNIGLGGHEPGTGFPPSDDEIFSELERRLRKHPLSKKHQINVRSAGMGEEVDFSLHFKSDSPTATILGKDVTVSSMGLDVHSYRRKSSQSPVSLGDLLPRPGSASNPATARKSLEESRRYKEHRNATIKKAMDRIMNASADYLGGEANFTQENLDRIYDRVLGD